MFEKYSIEKLIRELKGTSREIYTISQKGVRGKWFKVTLVNEIIIIEKSSENSPSINISQNRRISIEDFNKVAEKYDSWRNGLIERSIITEKSKNSSYILGIMAYLDRVRE